ncbi:MAG: adenylyl-sulfate kinase [Oscillospiraceae bacterium]
MAYQLTEINDAIRRDPKGFVAECEENYEKRIAAGAERILQNLSRSPIVLLSGPSGSGKTTTALKLEQELERRGVNTHTVSMDNYFKTLDRETVSRTPEGDIDYESPERLDMALLDQTFTALSKGEQIFIPKFDFLNQKLLQNHDRPLQLKKNEIAIFEGIHALNDATAGRHPEATTLYISARSNVNEGEEWRFKGTWMRLTRRVIRDNRYRKKDFAETLSLLYNVRRGEKKYISPFKGRAEIIIDSSLRYEVSLFKNYAPEFAEAAKRVSPENPRYAELQDWAAAFRYFEPVDAALVPGNSLMREFIGDSSYHY